MKKKRPKRSHQNIPLNVRASMKEIGMLIVSLMGVILGILPITALQAATMLVTMAGEIKLGD